MQNSGNLRNPDYYYPSERRTFSREYQEVIESILPSQWRIYPTHYWTQLVGPEKLLKVQGWKIHISATIDSAKETLAIVAKCCWSANTEFKFATDPYIHHLLLSKNVRLQSGGKFMTIYPSSNEIFDDLLERLHSDLTGFEGPYILSDRQYKDSKVVFYRYGGFRPFEDTDVFGQTKLQILNDSFEYIEDLRLPRFYTPEFVVDRHQPLLPKTKKSTKAKKSSSSRIFGEYFEIERVIKYSNAGGVYLGHDVRDGRKVVIKEARPYISYGMSGGDARQQLRAEFELLQRISDLHIAPQPVALFSAWEHLFLVEEYIEGVSLQHYIAENSQIIVPSAMAADLRAWFQASTQIGVELLRLAKALHARGIVFGDFSANNVMISPGTRKVFLVDFESSFILGSSTAPNIFTQGYAPPGRDERDLANASDDQYALGCILLYMQVPSHINMVLMPDYVDMALKMVGSDFNIPPAYEECVRDLLGSPLIDLGDCADKLEDISYERISALAAKVPSDYASVAASQAGDCICYMKAHFSLDEDWRIFPVDTQQVFQLSMDHGVLGTVYALVKIESSIGVELRDWLIRACRYSSPLPGLLNGAAGAAWLFDEMDCRLEAAAQLRHCLLHPLLYTNASLGYGCAGVGMALVHHWVKSGDDQVLHQALRLADYLCESAVQQDVGCCWDVDADHSIQLGLHKGASGVALFLLHAYAASGVADYLDCAIRAVEFDMDKEQAHGLPEAYLPGQAPDISSPYLHSGMAGVAMVVLRLYGFTKEERYLSFLRRAKVLASQKYTVCGGLGLGLAGLGHFLLDYADWLDDTESLELAARVAQGLSLCLVRRPEGLAAPSHLGTTVSVSYLSGSAGMALFLNRLATKGEAFHFVIDSLLKGQCSSSKVHIHA